jgi:choline-phosphate cytidylyltransferase
MTNDANGEVDDAYGLCKKLGRFKATQRTQGISTTDLVTKILKNKEIYYVRNIRRGTSREKLGISRIRYFYLMCKMYLCPQIYEKKKKS